MQATLIYNPNSGGSSASSPEEISAGLRQAGYHPIYSATSREEDLDRILEDVEGLVVVAGGDGSLRAVATRLVGQGVSRPGREVFLAPLPMGTANNITRALCIEGEPLEIVAGLSDPLQRGFDVGRVRGPWGEDYFLEAFGYGLYADALEDYDPGEGKSVLRSLRSAMRVLANYETHRCQVWLDGQDISGSYLMFEALNTSAFGPRLKFAPAADPGDGLLDVVCIREDNQDGLLAYVTGLLNEELGELESVEVMRGRKLEISQACPFPFHLDAEVQPKDGAERGERAHDGVRIADDVRTPGGENIVVELLPRALTFLIPRGIG